MLRLLNFQLKLIKGFEFIHLTLLISGLNVADKCLKIVPVFYVKFLPPSKAKLIGSQKIFKYVLSSYFSSSWTILSLIKYLNYFIIECLDKLLSFKILSKASFSNGGRYKWIHVIPSHVRHLVVQDMHVK